MPLAPPSGVESSPAAGTPAPSSGGRVAGFDLLRALAAVAVVGIHVLAAGAWARGDATGMARWVYTTYTFIWFATPAFSFLTGVLVWNYRPITSREELISFFRRRASVVLYPYLVWSAFYLWFGYYTPTDLRPAMPLGDYLLDVVRLLVLGRASFHMYFLPIVLIFYALSPVISRLFRAWPWVTFAVLYSIGLFATIVVPAPEAGHGVTLYRLFVTTMWLLPSAAVGGLFGAVRVRYARFFDRAWPVLLALGMFGRWYDRGPLWVQQVWLQRINEFTYLGLALVGLVCMLDVLGRKAPRLASASRGLGAAALGVYLIHPVAIWAVVQVLDRTGTTALWAQPWFTLAVTVAVVVLCNAFVMLAGRSRWFAWALGMPGGFARRAGTVETG
ncbi:MAG: acyltransferase [Coriobacteriia bacterium]|nr:acyltransferase [Coriobacteriia bacterium]